MRVKNPPFTENSSWFAPEMSVFGSIIGGGFCVATVLSYIVCPLSVMTSVPARAGA